MEKIRKIIPFEVWQSEWLLRWLHEQSREGLELVKIRGNTAIFKPTTHINLTYGLFTLNVGEDAKISEAITGEIKVRKQALREQCEADGWTYIMEWQGFFVMQRTRLDAVPPPDISKYIDESRNLARWQAIGTLITLLLLTLNMDLKRGTYPHILWLVFMVLMTLALVGGLLYLPHVLTKKEEDVRPRDVSQEDYHRHLQRAKTLFLLKSAVFAGNIIGLAAQGLDLIIGLSS